MKPVLEKLKERIIRLDAQCAAEADYRKRMPIIFELERELAKYRKLAGLHEYASVGFLDRNK
jgi:hypothetical protein